MIVLATTRFAASKATPLLPLRMARCIDTSKLHSLFRSKSTLALTTTETLLEPRRTVARTTTNPFPDFGNARIAYENKSTQELLRAAICFRACKIPFLVEHAERSLLLVLQKLPVGGTRVVQRILEASFYGQFCAGRDQETIRPVVRQLKASGVGSILDYAAESDEPPPVGATRTSTHTTRTTPRNGTKTAREYDYESEAKCDQHLSSFLRCIRDVASTNSTTTNNNSNGKDANTGYAAIKVTALGNPKLLARLSTAIVEAKRLFSVFDANNDGLISRDEFELAYNRFFTDGNIRVPEIFREFDPLETGSIDYITWSMMLSPHDLPNIVKSCQNAGRLTHACPTDEEIALLNAMYERGRKLAKEAAKLRVRLLIDAEQVRYQPAIDNLVLELQRRFNVGDKPIVYNTYQCYLRDALERLKIDLARSERFGYHFGAKLVRGAYMESERELAESLNQEDPIHSSIEETQSCYDEAVDYLLRHSTLLSERNVEIMCATHNKDSIVNAIERMNSYGIDRTASTICFAQLYGMSDQLTFNLGKHGYRAFKYVPYGEVHEVIPYLLRRARENSAIVGGATEELTMIAAELKRRIGLPAGGSNKADTRG